MMPETVREPIAGAALVPSPRLILFDLDDTLGDYSTARASRLRHAFTPHLAIDSPAARERALQEMIERSIAISPHGTEHFPELFAAFGINQAEAAVTAADWYRRNRFHDLTLFPEAIEVIVAVRQLAEGQRHLGIVTNGPTAVQRDKVELLGLDRLVDFVVISGEVGIEKPDPRIFELALARAGTTADEAVVIGDAPEYDIAGARAAGIRSIWVNRRKQPWPIGEWEPTCVVHDLLSVLPLLCDSR